MTFPQPLLSAHVRPSIDSDMPLIHAWLKDQHKAGEETLFVNWNLTEEHHEEEKLLVYAEPDTNLPVAYHWGGLGNSGILEVRREMRGRGIGSTMVRHSMALAEDEGRYILRVQCAPESSVPFWEALGFERIRGYDERNHYAARLMRKKLPLPEGGDRVEVLVQWFHERRTYSPGVLPVDTQRIASVRQGSTVVLGERAVYHGTVDDGDTAVRIAVDGVELCCCKAKYEEAMKLGVERCDHGFFFNKINLT